MCPEAVGDMVRRGSAESTEGSKASTEGVVERRGAVVGVMWSQPRDRRGHARWRSGPAYSDLAVVGGEGREVVVTGAARDGVGGRRAERRGRKLMREQERT